MHRFVRPGFTFAEILVTLGVLAAALSPLFLMQTTVLTRAKESLPALLAGALAGEIAEQIRTLPVAWLPVGKVGKLTVGADKKRGLVWIEAAGGESRTVSRSETTASTSAPGTPVVIGAYPLEADVTVELEPLVPPDQLYRLIIVVAWMEGPSRTRQEYRQVELVDFPGGRDE